LLLLPNNIIIARPLPPPPPAPKPRLLNPIPQHTLDLFNITFFNMHSITIDTLTNLLQNESLNPEQWHNACQLFDDLNSKITETINNTCMAPPLPQLTNNTTRTREFLPRNLQKKWKKLIATHHLIRKIIYIAKHNPNWRNHPILHNLANTTIPPIPPPNIPHTTWLHEIASMEKDAQKEAHTIIAKHIRKSAQKAIIKFQNLINIKPKQGNKTIFRNSDNPPPPPLDSLMDLEHNIITHPIDIVDEIFLQQSKINAPTVKTYNHQPQHQPNCTCQVRQYP
jgi:hypothetical protein